MGGIGWRDLVVTSALGIEDGRKHGRAIEVGVTEPVDRSVACYQCTGTKVADDAVIFDRGVATGRRGPTVFRADG